jgi:hypothetical protein
MTAAIIDVDAMMKPPSKMSPITTIDTGRMRMVWDITPTARGCGESADSTAGA